MEAVFDFISELLLTNGVVIAAASFVVGQIVKGFKSIPNSFIPLIGGVVGIVLGISIPDIFAGKDLITSGVLGLILGWGATGGYETIRNLKK